MAVTVTLEKIGDVYRPACGTVVLGRVVVVGGIVVTGIVVAGGKVVGVVGRVPTGPILIQTN